MTRIELAVSRAVESHLMFNMPLEMAARAYGVSESTIIHEVEAIEHIDDTDYIDRSNV